MSRLTDIQELLRAPRVDRGAVGKLFEEAGPGERIEILECIDGRAQARL